MYKNNIILFISFLLFSSLPLLGQEEQDSEKKSAKVIERVEVVASPLRQSTEDAISLKTIRRQGAIDPAEAISSMTGIETSRRSSIAHPIILRGQTRDAVAVTIDGQNLWGACPGHMDPVTFHTDFAQVKEITVIRGPYDVTTPGAEAGSVDIKTNDPQVKPTAKASITYGMNNYVNASLEGSIGFKYMQVLAGYSYRQSQINKDGKGNLATTYVKNYKDEFKKAKAKAFGIHTGWTKIQVTPADGHKILFSGSYQNANGYKGILYYDRGMDAIKDEASMFRARWEGEKMGVLANTFAEVYWNKVYHLMDTSNRKNPTVATAKGFSETVGSKIGSTAQLDNIDISFGIDFYRRRWDISHSHPMMSIMIPDVHTFNTGLFLEYNHAFGEKTGLVLAGRADFAQVRAKKDNIKFRKQEWANSTNERNFYLFGGNMQVNHYVVPELNLFLGLGHGARLPDPKELFTVHPMRTRGNSHLKPEHKTEVDIGLEAKHKFIETRLNLFYAYVANFIAEGKSQNLIQGMGGLKPGSTYYNTNAHMGGFELDFNILMPLGFSLVNQVAMTIGGKQTTATLKSKGIELPPLTGMSGFRWQWDKGLYLQTDVKYAAPQKNLNGDNARDKASKGWATWNFSAGYEHKYFAIRLTVDNILNSFYHKHNSYIAGMLVANPQITRVPEQGVDFKIQVEGKYN